MENRIVIPIGEYRLVAEKGADYNYNEIFIWLEDKNGVEIHNVALVGQQYHYDENLNTIQDNGIFVKVYADEDIEDYTHQFDINI